MKQGHSKHETQSIEKLAFNTSAFQRFIFTLKRKSTHREKKTIYNSRVIPARVYRKFKNFVTSHYHTSPQIERRRWPEAKRRWRKKRYRKRQRMSTFACRRLVHCALIARGDSTIYWRLRPIRRRRMSCENRAGENACCGDRRSFRPRKRKVKSCNYPINFAAAGSS